MPTLSEPQVLLGGAIILLVVSGITGALFVVALDTVTAWWKLNNYTVERNLNDLYGGMVGLVILLAFVVAFIPCDCDCEVFKGLSNNEKPLSAY